MHRRKCLHAWRNACQFRRAVGYPKLKGLSRILADGSISARHGLARLQPEGTARFPRPRAAYHQLHPESQKLRGQADHQSAMWAGPAAALPGSRFFGRNCQSKGNGRLRREDEPGKGNPDRLFGRETLKMPRPRFWMLVH